MTVWALRYFDQMSQRDLGTLALAIAGLLLFFNVLVFARKHPPQLPTLTNVDDWYFIILLGGLVARLAWIWVPGPWYDEAFTVLISRLNVHDLIAATAGDVHPPFYYFLTAYLDGSLIGIRLLSVLFSMVSLALFWRVMIELGLQPVTRLATLAAVTCMPTQVYYGQEARMYALLQLWIMLMVLAMLRREWAVLFLATCGALWTHNYGLYYAAVIFGLAYWRDWRRRVFADQLPTSFTSITITGAAALAAFAPWLVVLANQMGRLRAGYWIQDPTVGSVLYDLLQIVFGVFLPDWAAIPAGIFLGSILAGALYYGVRQRRWTELALAFGALALALLTGLVYRPVLLYRALLPTLPFLAILVAVAVSAERRAWLWAGPAALTLALGFGWLLYENSTGASRPHSIMLPPEQSTSARVVHLNDASLLGYMLYRPDQAHYLLKKDGCTMDGALSDQTRAALGIDYIAEEELLPGDEIAMIVGPLANACMVDAYHRLAAISTPVATLDKTYWVEGVWQYVGE